MSDALLERCPECNSQAIHVRRPVGRKIHDELKYFMCNNIWHDQKLIGETDAKDI